MRPLSIRESLPAGGYEGPSVSSASRFACCTAGGVELFNSAEKENMLSLAHGNRLPFTSLQNAAIFRGQTRISEQCRNKRQMLKPA